MYVLSVAFVLNFRSNEMNGSLKVDTVKSEESRPPEEDLMTGLVEMSKFIKSSFILI